MGIWLHKSGSTLAQVVAYCLAALSHDLIIKGILWHSPVSNFIGIAQDTSVGKINRFFFQIMSTSLRGHGNHCILRSFVVGKIPPIIITLGQGPWCSARLLCLAGNVSFRTDMLLHKHKPKIIHSGKFCCVLLLPGVGWFDPHLSGISNFELVQVR